MNKELRELLESIQNKKAEAKAFAKDNKIEEAKALITEINALQDRFDVESQLVEDGKGEVTVKNKVENKDTDNIVMKAFKRAIAGKSLTEEMQAALVSNTDADGGYLVPNQVANEINELRREYKSLKELVDVVPVQTAKGSIVVEDKSSIQNLVDFDEVGDLAEQSPKFTQVAFALKNKGAITPISNTLLADEQSGLPAYVTRLFVKKAIRTENADILAQLKAGKTAKQYTDVKSIKKAVNKELDPSLVGEGAAFIMNQDAFNHLDQEVDGNGRPVLQPNVADSSKKIFLGLPVHVVSNNELATTGTTTKKAPIFFGNFVEGVKFFDRQAYQVSSSSEAGFTKNQTLLRVIERYDVKSGDAEAYIFGELDVTATI